MNWRIRVLIALLLILAAAQIGRLRAEEPAADLAGITIIGDSIAAHRVDKILTGDRSNHEKRAGVIEYTHRGATRSRELCNSHASR